MHAALLSQRVQAGKPAAFGPTARGFAEAAIAAVSSGDALNNTLREPAAACCRAQTSKDLRRCSCSDTHRAAQKHHQKKFWLFHGRCTVHGRNGEIDGDAVLRRPGPPLRPRPRPCW